MGLGFSITSECITLIWEVFHRFCDFTGSYWPAAIITQWYAKACKCPPSVALHFEKVSGLCCAGEHAILSWLTYLTLAFRNCVSATASLGTSSQNIKHAKQQSVAKEPNDGCGTYCWKSHPVLAADRSDRSHPSLYLLGLMLHFPNTTPVLMWMWRLSVVPHQKKRLIAFANPCLVLL